MQSNHLLIKEIKYKPSIEVFAQFADSLWAVYLDSASRASPHSRYSIIAIEPFLTMTCKNEIIHLNDQVLKGVPFSVLQAELNKYRLNIIDPSLPFYGGAIGYFAYDLCHHLEQLPRAACDDMSFPDLAIGFYDLLIIFDENEKKSWIVSNGYPEQDEMKRANRAAIRYQSLLEKLSIPISIDQRKEQELYPTQIDVCKEDDITSNFTSEEYKKAVQKVIDYIYAGDIFQANLSQRFTCMLPAGLTPFQLYCRLREQNPAPFSAYLNLPDVIIASASPERFLQLTNGQVQSCPIKGTRPRNSDPKIDQKLMQALLNSEKDHAENTMIVDLIRNDLSRVCEDNSVNVPCLCTVESYATVHHLVSTVTGQLIPQANAIDLLKATFPGGSITGAPKVRAMEIIAELEPTARGPYCGCIGYIGFDGNMDTSITIRTYAIKNNIVTFQAGGGIVADSTPEMEFQETLDKAHALRTALTGSSV